MSIKQPVLCFGCRPSAASVGFWCGACASKLVPPLDYDPHEDCFGDEGDMTCAGEDQS